MRLVVTLLCLFLPLSACGATVVRIQEPAHATPDQVNRETENLRRVQAHSQFRPQLYLECGDQQTTRRAVSQLTYAQLLAPSYAVSFNDLPDRCRAGNVTLGGFPTAISLWPTEDGRLVEVVTYQQSNGYVITFANAYHDPFALLYPRRRWY